MRTDTSESIDMNLTSKGFGTGTERVDLAVMSGQLTGIPYPGGDSTELQYSFLLPAVTDDELGRLGNYRVLKLLGRGGMGFVFLAEDLALKRPVALKVMTPSQATRADGFPRFLREARILASIKHPNIVAVYQAGQERDVAFIAMELLSGETLAEWQRRVKAARPEEAIRIGKGIAAGLTEVHKHGLVHRDIKPANVWIEEGPGTVKLLDFGLARSVDDNEFTKNGTILGTPAYMSPEQARGDKLDARSDLFSLGSVLYGICTGTPPFAGNNTLATLTALAMGKFRPVREVNPLVPQRLSDLIDRLLAKEPNDRPESAEVVRKVLGKIGVGEDETVPDVPPRVVKKKRKKKPAASASKKWWALGGVVAAVVLSGVAIGLIATRKPAGGVPAAAAHVTYLSDLVPVEESGWLRQPPPPGDRPPRPGMPPPRSGPFEPRVGGARLAHGLFMHPQPRPGNSVARGSFRIDNRYATFRSIVGLNDDNGGRTDVPLAFSVLGDGKVLWTSKGIQFPGDRDECRIDVSGVSVLTLEVHCPGPPKAAHAVWVDPRLEN